MLCLSFSKKKCFGCTCVLGVIIAITQLYYLTSDSVNGYIKNIGNSKEKQILDDTIKEVEYYIFNKSRLNSRTKSIGKYINKDTIRDVEYWTLNHTGLTDIRKEKKILDDTIKEVEYYIFNKSRLNSRTKSNGKYISKDTIRDVEYWTLNHTGLTDIRIDKLMEDSIRDVKHWRFNETRLYETRLKLYQHLLRHNFSAEIRYLDFLEYAVNKDHIHYKRCSIVGNGGILKKSGCGSDIDKADYVFRANLPWIRNFTDDAGKKTNFSTFNPSIISTRYHNKLSGFMKDLDAYQGHLMFSRTERMKGVKRTFLSYVQKNTTLIDLEIDLNYLFAVKTFWLCNKSATSGLLLVNLALTRCDELHLFGFWPFDTDEEGNDIPHHYTEDIKWNKSVAKVHYMPYEFRILKELHTKGVLELHIGKCE